jgi:tRNA-specific 2-thiouridylase
VVCNREIKCGRLLDEMAAHGMDRMATGHYAQIIDAGGQARLHRAVDPKKDQSYFLCRLSARQRERLLLPLGSWQKSEVFQRAQDMGFTHFNGQESQDVCFLANQHLAVFLTDQGIKNRPGELVTRDGQVLGRHVGIWKYTVGQRRGLGLPDTTPWYVTGLDAQKNQVLIGKNEELFRQRVLLRDVKWMAPQPNRWQGGVQLRSRHQPARAEVLPLDDNSWQVLFAEPQRAITPGQFAVFYQDDQVMGSGIIETAPAG